MSVATIKSEGDRSHTFFKLLTFFTPHKPQKCSSCLNSLIKMWFFPTCLKTSKTEKTFISFFRIVLLLWNASYTLAFTFSKRLIALLICTRSIFAIIKKQNQPLFRYNQRLDEGLVCLHQACVWDSSVPLTFCRVVLIHVTHLSLELTKIFIFVT